MAVSICKIFVVTVEAVDVVCSFFVTEYLGVDSILVLNESVDVSIICVTVPVFPVPEIFFVTVVVAVVVVSSSISSEWRCVDSKLVINRNVEVSISVVKELAVSVSTILVALVVALLLVVTEYSTLVLNESVDSFSIF